MATRIEDTTMTSDATAHRADRDGDGWRVTWLPVRVLSHAQAVTAMAFADAVALLIADPAGMGRLRPHLSGWASELGVCFADALVLASDLVAHPGCEGDLS